MGFFSKVFKGIKKGVKGIFKGIKKVVKPIGKLFKKVLKPFGKLANKLGPIGTMALMFIAPYALPAIWGAFGTWAAGLTGPMAGMMQGIHTAGMAIGKAYTTVTGFISDTIGKIASNTIGKIPLGQGRTVGSVFTNFKNNMAMRLEGRNLNYGNNIVDTTTGTKSTGFLQAEKLAADNINLIKDQAMSDTLSQSLSRFKLEGLELPTDYASAASTFDRSLAFGEQLQAGVTDISKSLNLTTFQDSVAAATQPTSLLSPSGYFKGSIVEPTKEATREIITGFTHEHKLGMDAKTMKDVKLDYLTPETKTVPLSYLEANPQIVDNHFRLQEYQATVNAYAQPYLPVDTGPTQPIDQFKITKDQIKADAFKVAGVVDTLQGTTEEDIANRQQSAGMMNYDSLALARVQQPGLTDYSSDFSNLSNQYSAAGYGPETDYTSLSSQYSAGAYGGAGFMSQVSSRFLQPTIGMPRMG